VTNAQKLLVGDMRAAGQGYKQIAATLGISANTIKSYCYRGNLTRHDASKETGIKEINAIKENKEICKQCGVVLLQRSGLKQRTFCSAECRVRWWSKNRNQLDGASTVLKRCERCGAPFRSQLSAKRKYCGHACYVLAHYGKEARHDAGAV